MKRPGEETLIRYFRGQSPPEEENAVKLYLAMNIDEEYVASCLQEAYSNEADTTINKEELDRLWGRLAAQQTGQPIVHLRPRIRWYAYAAAIAFLVFGSTIFFLLNTRLENKPSREMAWKQLSAGTGHPEIIQLADNSIVTLFPGSAIDIPDDFNQAERKIKLTGRAFFQVSHHANKPFYVASQGLITEVLGTSFEINSSAMNGESIVTLHTGKISISHGDKEIVRLNPDQQIRYRESTGNYDVVAVHTTGTPAWMEGELEYEQETLKTIIHDLEKWYGVKVNTATSTLLNRKVTISFKDLPVNSALGMLSTSAGFTYTVTGNQITLYERARN